MLRCLFLLCIAALMSSCAKPPLQKLDAAEYMINRALEKQAQVFAQSEYMAAHNALEDARRAIDESDYKGARETLDYALLHARRAVALAEERQAKRALEEAAQKRREQEDEKARQEALRIQQEETSPPAKAPASVAKPAPKPNPKIVMVNSYTVGEGETLWTISAQPQVYGDGLLWPLLYQANRDQIKDPRQIFPGQTLSIPRDMTEKELEDARQKARESDIFPVPGAGPEKQ
jgi:nucleoid-associated protein YgaU